MVVSARPDNLDKTADEWDRLNTGADGFSSKQSDLATAFNNFSENNGWGALDAGALVGNVSTWVTANTNDATFTRTVAEAFRQADSDGAGIAYATDALILSMIAPAGVTWSDLHRGDLVVSPSTAYGGQITTGFAIDPVSTATGNFFEVEVDLAFGPTLRGLQVRRSYNSMSELVGPFGPGWSSWASARLKLGRSGQYASLVGPDGQVAMVPMPDGTVPGFEGRVEVLASSNGANQDGAEPEAGEPVLVARFDKEQMSWFFDVEGRPVLVDEGVGTRVTLSWDDQRLVGLSHERGRSLRFEWDEAGERIVTAVADDGRRVTYHYDELGRLVRVDAPMGARFYEWDSRDRIAAVSDADGVVAARNVYDAEGRVVVQETAAGRRVRFWYRDGLVTEVDDESGGPANVWVHDENARLVKVVDGHGEATTKAYDDDGRVIRVRDRRGAMTHYSWDDRGNCTRIEYPNGTVVETEYDDRHRVVAASGPEGGTARFVYDGDSRHPSLIEDPEGGVTRLEVVDDLVKSITDPDGVRASFEHDAEGRIVAVTDGAGATHRMEYHPTGQLAAVVSPLGHRTEYERDSAGRLVARRDTDGAVSRIERSAAGRITAVVEPTGARREYRHGADGEVEQALDPTGAATSFQRNEHGSIVAAVLPDGGKWTFEHDALLRVVGVTDPAGATWLREHDAEGALVGSISPTGVQRKVAVDDDGMITKVDDGLTTVGFEYDAAGRAVAKAHPDGNVARVAYDRCGRILEITEPGGGISRFEYTKAGRLHAVTGPTGARTTHEYDAAGRIRTIVLPAGGRRRFRYDPDGRLVRVTSPTGEVTRYSYDAAGRPIAAMLPSGGVMRWDYDAAGQLVKTTGADGAVTQYTYDVAGRVTTVTNPMGSTVRYEHDLLGRVVASTDPLGARYEQQRDPMGRITHTIDPLGRRTSYTYDQGGRLVGRVDPDGSRRWWRWDDADDLAAWGVDGTETVLRRDLLGRLVEVVRDGVVAMTRTWDADSNLVVESTDDYTMRWEYDLAGNVIATTLAVSGFEPVTTRYDLDAAGRVVAVSDPTVGRITIERDQAGRPLVVEGAGLREQRSWVDGMLAGWSREIEGQPTQSVRYVRDQAGRIVHEQDGDGRSVRYDYDLAGQLVGMDDVDGAWRFEWDAAGRLVHEEAPTGARSFSYDAAGQLVTASGPSGVTRFEWDACGRRVAEIGPDGERHYGWDDLGQLSSIRTTLDDGEPRTRTLRHDVVGRLAGVDGTPLVWDTASDEKLVSVGGHRMVGAGPATWAVADSREHASWLSSNARGEPRGLDPWGTAGVDPSSPAGRTAALFPQLPGELGLGHRGELDVDGLVWLRARAYDPTTRSFLSPDPLPGIAGDPWGNNPYHYAANDPVGHADPLGLRPVTDAELANIRDTWDDNAFQRYEGYIIAGALVIAGAALVATGVGGIVGGALIGMAVAGAISAGTQQYFNGGVNYGQLAMDMALGAVGGGAGAAATLSTQGLKFGARYAIRAGVDMTVNVGSGMATRAYNGENPLDPQGLALDVATGGVSAGAGETMDAIRDARMHARMRPNVNNPVGLSPQDAATALDPSRLQHGTRHLRPPETIPDDMRASHLGPNDNVYGNWSGKNSPAEVRSTIGPILERPFATFQGNLGGTPTTGYLGQINGQTVAVQVFDSGPKAGQLATTVVPTPGQLDNWGITR